jgi:hypothetical protein
MTTPRVVKQELVVHLFAPLDGPRAGQAYEQLARMWTACQDRLEMTEAIPGFPAPALPAGLPGRSGPERVLAAQLNSATGHQAIARVLHDVLNVSVGLAQPPAGRAGLAAPGWTDLARTWAEVGEGLTAMLGEARLLLARTPPGEPAPIAASTGLGQALGSLLPASASRAADWWWRGVTTSDGYALWDTGAPADLRESREVLLVCAADWHCELSAWAWSDGTAALPPFAAYLMHAAKVRYEARLLEAWHARGESPAEVTASPRARKRLAEIEANLDRLRKTADIARDNLSTAAGREAAGESGGLFATDRELAHWLADQAQADLDYLRIEIGKIARPGLP